MATMSQTLRGITRFTQLALVCAIVSACVTIYVTFPAASAEKAADQIIDAVTGTAAPRQGSGTPTAPPLSQRFPEPNILVAALGQVLYAIVPAAHAQGAANLDISSPEIRAITASMQARFPQLQKFFDSGALGMTQNGLIEVRDASGVSLPERGLLNRLVAEDNKDRETLYTEIAKANSHPEWADDIRRTFARRWVERGARAGWYYQNASGAWVQK
jgi:uncharacterized protein